MENLRIAKEVLDRLNIPFVLDCGTLLFVVRENRLDPTDTDISICFTDSAILLDNLDHFIKRGFKIHQIYSHPTIGVTEVSFRRNDQAFDIFIRRFKGGYCYGVSQYDGRYVRFRQPQEFFIGELSQIEFDGLRYFVPTPVEKYLAYYYGDDWRTPKPNWDSSKDAPCIDKDFVC